MPNYDINPNLAGKLPSEGIAHLRELLSVNLTNNTSDASKPVSSDTQDALDLKANLASPNFSGVPTLAGEPLATQAFATAAAGNSSVNKHAVHSAFGEGLIDMVVTKSGKAAQGANIFWFSTNKTSDITVTIGSSTGYVLPILADGSNGTRAGDGNTASPEAIAFHPGGGYTSPRAAGMMSVAELGTTPSGAITQLQLSDDGLTNLNVSGMTSLLVLDCSYNWLIKLDVSGLVVLTQLECADNHISELNVTDNPELAILQVAGNPLTELDLSGNAVLERLSVMETLITSLDLSNNLLLEYLDGSVSQIASLDLSANTALETIILSLCPLDQNAVNQILQDVDAYGTSGGSLELEGCAAPSGAGLTAKANLQARGWTVLTD